MQLADFLSKKWPPQPKKFGKSTNIPQSHDTKHKSIVEFLEKVFLYKLLWHILMYLNSKKFKLRNNKQALTKKLNTDL